MRAFTLIELLTVIAIIGILAALSAPVFHAFTPNVVAAATRQLLDDVAHARQLAIGQRTTVYMVFAPTNFWSDLGYGLLGSLTPPLGTPSEQSKANRLLDKQLIAYTFVSLHSMGDQPGRFSPRYLGPWKTLPQGAFIVPQKFLPYPPSMGMNLPVMTIYTNGNTLPAYRIYAFARTNSIPFPSENVVNYANAPAYYVTLPYIAFNYMGQLVSGQDELIPLAKGAAGFARNPDKTPAQALPTFTEAPSGNSTNAYNIVKIDWLTGRARAEHLEVR